MNQAELRIRTRTVGLDPKPQSGDIEVAYSARDIRAARCNVLLRSIGQQAVYKEFAKGRINLAELTEETENRAGVSFDDPVLHTYPHAPGAYYPGKFGRMVVTVDDLTGQRQSEAIEDHEDGGVRLRRLRLVDWANLTGVVQADVEDATKRVDVRGRSFVNATIIAAKPTLSRAQINEIKARA